MLLLHVLFFAAIALSMSEKRRLIKAPRGVIPRAPSAKAAQGLFPGNDNWEAGYIDFPADGTTFHFFYFLARSRNDPVNDPTVFWFTGMTKETLDVLVLNVMCRRTRMLERARHAGRKRTVEV